MWWLVALVAVVAGAVVDIFDKDRRNSAFAISLVFAFLVGVGYVIKLIYQLTVLGMR